MITSPLDLLSRLNRPPRDLDVMHWISTAGIAVFFGLIGSKFVLTPGLLMGEEGQGFALPQMGTEARNVATAPVVVGFRRDNVILFEGGVYKRLSDLAGPLEIAGRAHRGEVLHVMADRQVSVSSISELAALAVRSGFASVLVAGQAEKTETAPFAIGR